MTAAFALPPLQGAFSSAALTAKSAATFPTVASAGTALSLSASGNAVAAALPTALALVGGGGSAAAVDISRLRLRLEGLLSYATITTLLMNSALRLFSSTPKNLVEGAHKITRLENIAKTVFAMLIASCVISSSYTTIVYSLLGLYTKRALGRGLEEEALVFMDSTKWVRDSGYTTFFIALVTFKVSFDLSLFLQYKGKLRWWLFVGAVVAGVLGWVNWLYIMKIGSAMLAE